MDLEERRRRTTPFIDLSDLLAPVEASLPEDQLRPEWGSWSAMIARCSNLQDPHYGAAGIRVCKRWENFRAFLADLGPRPSRKHSLDRNPDPFGHYEPGNVRWATQKEQGELKRNSRLITHEGVTRSLAHWATILGCHTAAIVHRVRVGGMTWEAALAYVMVHPPYQRPRGLSSVPAPPLPSHLAGDAVLRELLL